MFVSTSIRHIYRDVLKRGWKILVSTRHPEYGSAKTIITYNPMYTAKCHLEGSWTHDEIYRGLGSGWLNLYVLGER